MVVGVYLKIVPFLTWLRCFSSRAGAPGVPTPKDLTRPAPVWATLLLLPAPV